MRTLYPRATERTSPVRLGAARKIRRPRAAVVRDINETSRLRYRAASPPADWPGVLNNLWRGLRRLLTRVIPRVGTLEEMLKTPDTSGRSRPVGARRDACRPRDDVVLKDHEYAHRRVTLHDVETRAIYLSDHLAGIKDLRAQFAERGIRSRELDRYLASPENGADLRTISTALLEMASRLGR